MEKLEILEENDCEYKRMCRICMSSTEISYYDIFEDQNLQNINIADEIFFVTSLEIQPSDTLPKFICLSCFSDLKTAVNFKEICYKSQKLFQQNLIYDKTDIEFYDPDVSYDSDPLQENLIEEINEIKTKFEIKSKKKKFKKDPEPNLDDSDTFQVDFIEDVEEIKTKIKLKPKKVRAKRLTKENVTNAPQCELCGKICTNLARLRDHKLVAHEGEKSEICSFCNKAFALKLQLRRHLDIHLNKRQWKCDFGSCNRGFNDRTGLRSHRFICPERTVIDKPHECEICHKTFPFPARLKDHMQMYHLGSKRFGCEECEKVFTRPFKLKEHMRVHTGEKPYKCYYCDKLFRCQKHLKPHHMTSHKDLLYIGEGRKIDEIINK